MKIINLVAEVPENTLDELKAEVMNLIQDKYGGAVTDVRVTDAPKKGAGATLASSL